MADFRCPTCGATKEIIGRPDGSPIHSKPIPDKVPCGWRGCPDRAVRTAPENASSSPEEKPGG